MKNNEFKQDKDYPTWNPKDTANIPGTPNWTNTYGKNTLSFGTGSKPCYVNLKHKDFNKKEVPCGDYTIQIKIPSYSNYQQITDSEFISILKKEKSDLSSLKTKATNNFNTFKKEKELTENINKENLSDIEKLFLNYAWHRCIIEERIYQQPYYGGCKTFLNIIK
jgi:hypothetical protein